MYLEELPPELILVVCSYLGRTDLLHLRAVCPKLEQIVGTCPGLKISLVLDLSKQRDYLRSEHRTDSFLTPSELQRGKISNDTARFWVNKVAAIRLIGDFAGRWAWGRINRLFNLLEKYGQKSQVDLIMYSITVSVKVLSPIIRRINLTPVPTTFVIFTNQIDLRRPPFPVWLIKEKAATLIITCGESMSGYNIHSEYRSVKKVLKTTGQELSIENVVKMLQNGGLITRCDFQDCDFGGNIGEVSELPNVKTISFHNCLSFCTFTDFSSVLSLAFQTGDDLKVMRKEGSIVLATVHESLALVGWSLVDVLQICDRFASESIKIIGFTLTASDLTKATRIVKLQDCTIVRDSKTPLTAIFGFFYPNSTSSCMTAWRRVALIKNDYVKLEGWDMGDFLELDLKRYNLLLKLGCGSFSSKFMDIAINLIRLRRLEFSHFQVVNDSGVYPLSRVKCFCELVWGPRKKLKVSIFPASFVIENRIEFVGWHFLDVMDTFASENIVTLTDLTIGKKVIAFLHENIQVEKCKADFGAEGHDVNLEEVFAHLFKGASSLTAIIAPSSVKLESEKNGLSFFNWDYSHIFRTLIAIEQPLKHAVFHLPFVRSPSLLGLVQQAFLDNDFSFSVLHASSAPPQIQEIFSIVEIPFQASYTVDVAVNNDHSIIKFSTCTLVLPSWSPCEVLGLFGSTPFPPRISTRIKSLSLSNIDLTIELLDALATVQSIETLVAELDGEDLREVMTKREVRKIVKDAVTSLILKGLKRLSFSGNFAPTFHI